MVSERRGEMVMRDVRGNHLSVLCWSVWVSERKGESLTFCAKVWLHETMVYLWWYSYASINVQTVFMGCGFTSGWQELGSVFSAVVYKIQASERYIESLLLVPKDKKNLLLTRWKVHCTAASWSHVCPPVRQLIGIWKSSICPTTPCTGRWWAL